MKVIWEAEDIYAGLKTQKPGTGETGAHMVGYTVQAVRNDKRFAVISLADGLIFQQNRTAEEVALYLNENGDFPAEMIALATRGKDRL